MAHVMVLDTKDEDIFVCGLCKSVFNSLQMFLIHKRLNCSSQSAENLKDVDTIQSSVVTETYYENVGPSQPVHEITSQQINPENTLSTDFPCLTCKKKFKKVKTLQAHMRTHTEKPYQCPICGRCFVQNSHLQRHITSHKIWPDGLNETTAKSQEVDLLSYTCSYCNLIVAKYSQYRTHLKKHLSVKKFKCIQGDCVEFYETVESLVQHVSVSHESPIYCCHICNSNFNTLEDIATHQQSHNDPSKDVPPAKLRLYKCSQCDARFRKLEKLNLHMLTDNHEKVCIHCKKTFASDKRLRLHLQIHREFKPFQCNICNSSFHMKKYLSSHMLKHGSSQFKCSICKYMFKRQDLLHRHMKVHQTKKMFKCPFKDTLHCLKEFSRSDKLKLHIKCHTKYVSKHMDIKGKIL